MVTSAELIRLVLAQSGGPDRVAALRRFLRVPEAWIALRKRVSEPAWQAADLSQPMSEFVRRSHTRAISEESQDNPTPQAETASLISRMAADEGELLAGILDTPTDWRSAVALRWGSLEDQKGFVTSALAEESFSANIAIIDVLLANLDLGQTLNFLHDASPIPAAFLRTARFIHETDLRDALVAAASSGDLELSSIVGSFHMGAMGHLIGEPHTSDGQELKSAWENSTRQRAWIAELMAYRAEADQDTVTAIEAMSKAVQAESTASRRARLAELLIETGRWDEAQVTLGPEPRSAPELVVQASIYWAQGSKSHAVEGATQAQRALQDSPFQANRWINSLVSLLEDIGELEQAQEVLRSILAIRPSNCELQIAFAQLSNAAGDYTAAESAATIAGLLDPGNDTVLRELAVSLQENGKHAKALPIWRELADADNSAQRALVECCLKVGDSESALDVARQLVERENPSPEEMVLFGRSLLAAGQFRPAKSALERAVEGSPEYAPGWLALADCLKRNSDPAALEVLPRAVQACPGSADLMAALASQQLRAGAPEKALTSAEKAHRMGADSPEFLQIYAALLRDSGDEDRAFSLLTQAHKSRPADQGLRVSLAAMAEARDDAPYAYELVRGLQPSGHYEQELIGRLAAKISQSDGDRGTAEKAVELLMLAADAAEIEADSRLWLAHTLLFTERPEQAMRMYAICEKSMEADEDPLRIECIRGQAESAIAAGQIPVAISALELARDTEIADADTLALLAEAYSFAGLHPEALVEAERALALEPDLPRFRRIFLEACQATGSWHKGLAQIDSWTSFGDSDIHLSMERALFLAKLSRQQEARSAAAHALWTRRHDPGFLGHAQQLLQDMGEWRAAHSVLSSLDSRTGLDETLLREFASVSSKAGKLQAAADLWLELAKSNPTDSHSLSAAAECLHELGQVEQAIDCWEKALAADPSNGDLHARMARALVQAGRSLPALQHYQSAVTLSDGDAMLTLEAAQAHAKNGSLNSADELLRGLLDRQPEHVEARRFLARTLLERQMPAEAAGVIDQDDQLAKSVQGLAISAMAALDLEEPERAAQLLEKALDLDPDSFSAIELISQAALQAGSWDAVDSLFSGVDLSVPGSHETVLLLAQVRGRLAEVSWLLREMAKTRAHAPSADACGSEQIGEIESYLESAEVDPTTKSECIAFLKITFGQEDFQDSSAAAMNFPGPQNQAWQAESIAIAHLRHERPEQAILKLADLPASTRLGEWSPILAGLAHMQARRPQLALKAFSAVQSELWAPVADYLQGQVYRSIGETSQALQALNRAVVAWPTEVIWQRELGELYLEDAAPETAVPHLQQASELSVHDPAVDLLLARSLRDAGQLREAAIAYEKTLPDAEGDPTPWREAAGVYADLGDYPRAAEMFEQALAVDSIDPQSLVGVSRALFRMGETSRAREYANLAVRHAPDQPEALTVLADILSRNGNAEQALDLYDEAARLGTSSFDLHKARSDLLLKVGRPEEAMQALKQAAQEDPDDVRVWLAISEVFEIHDDLISARDAIRQAMTIQPSRPELRLALARLARKSGQLDQALAELFELEEEIPEDPALAIEIGRVHRSRREFRRALNAFQRAAELEPQSALAHFLSGMVLKEIKAYPRAADCFKKAVELNPKDTDALHQLAAVRALELVHGGMKPSAVTS